VATSSNPLGRWLRSRRNIAGCVGALVAVALGAAGVLPAPWWPAAVVALYAAGALAFRGPAGGVDELYDDRVDVRRLRAALAAHRRRAEGAMTGQTRDDVLASIDRLTTTLGALFDRPDLLHRGAPETFEIERLVDDYLPTALEAYLRLPAEFADTQPLSDGHTAREVLLEQLGLLERGAQEATEAASRGEADQLLAFGRFLAGRFGPQNPALDLSAPGALPPPAPAPLDLATPKDAAHAPRRHGPDGRRGPAS
jgi:hypothetical protein